MNADLQRLIDATRNLDFDGDQVSLQAAETIVRAVLEELVAVIEAHPQPTLHAKEVARYTKIAVGRVVG